MFKQVLEFEMKGGDNQKYYNKGSFESHVYDLATAAAKQQKQGVILLKTDYDEALLSLHKAQPRVVLKSFLNLFIPQVNAKQDQAKARLKKLMSKIDPSLDAQLSFEGLLEKLRSAFKQLQIDYSRVLRD